jgi:hypothetical protein
MRQQKDLCWVTDNFPRFCSVQLNCRKMDEKVQKWRFILWWWLAPYSTHVNIRNNPAEVPWSISKFKRQSYIKTLSPVSFNWQRNPETRAESKKIQQKMVPSFAFWWSEKVAGRCVTEVIVSVGNRCRAQFQQKLQLVMSPGSNILLILIRCARAPEKVSSQELGRIFPHKKLCFLFRSIKTTSSVETPTKGYKIQSGLFRWRDICRVVQWKEANFMQSRLANLLSAHGWFAVSER